MVSQFDIITGGELIAYPGAAALDAETATAWAKLASAEVFEHWPNPVNPAPGRVKNLTLEVAARAARNPEGLASWTRAVDDGSRTGRLPESAARAGIFLTADEIVKLRGDTGAAPRRQRYGSIRPRLGRS